MLKESKYTLSAVLSCLLERGVLAKRLEYRPLEGNRRLSCWNSWYEPDDINSPESVELLKSLNADIFICDYGRILSKEVLLTTLKHGGVNLHGSLLPKYRGAANQSRHPKRERELGVSVIFIEPSVDSGNTF